MTMHRIIFVIGLLLSCVVGLYAQNETPQIENSPIREEIQRYIGYEDLLPRYVSLPYDVTMNTNVQGEYLDMSFLLLALLPVVFLLGMRKHWWVAVSGILLLLLMLVLSVATGYGSIYNLPPDQVMADIQKNIEMTSFSEAPVLWTSLRLRSLFVGAYEMMAPLLSQITGESDAVTYPLVLLSFLAVFYLLDVRLREHSVPVRAFVFLTLFFSFLWFLLSAGILWYGLLMIPAAIVLLMKGWTSVENTHGTPAKFVLWGILGVWLAMAYTYRMSNYNPADENTAKFAAYPIVMQYAAGQAETSDVLEQVFPQYERAVNFINQNDEDKVYRVGTYMNYFVSANNERVLSDNQLGLFSQLAERYPNKIELAQVFKSNNYRYFIIDLRTPEIDQTPEQSLRKKFEYFLRFLYQNPALELVATDNIIRNENGQNVYEVFGEDRVRQGNFAVYRIK